MEIIPLRYIIYLIVFSIFIATGLGYLGGVLQKYKIFPFYLILQSFILICMGVVTGCCLSVYVKNLICGN